MDITHFIFPPIDEHLGFFCPLFGYCELASGAMNSHEKFLCGHVFISLSYTPGSYANSVFDLWRQDQSGHSFLRHSGDLELKTA